MKSYKTEIKLNNEQKILYNKTEHEEAVKSVLVTSNILK